MNKLMQTKEEKALNQRKKYDMMQNIISKQAMETFKRPAFSNVKAVQENRKQKH